VTITARYMGLYCGKLHGQINRLLDKRNRYLFFVPCRYSDIVSFCCVRFAETFVPNIGRSRRKLTIRGQFIFWSDSIDLWSVANKSIRHCRVGRNRGEFYLRPTASVNHISTKPASHLKHRVNHVSRLQFSCTKGWLFSGWRVVFLTAARGLWSTRILGW